MDTVVARQLFAVTDFGLAWAQALSIEGDQVRAMQHLQPLQSTDSVDSCAGSTRKTVISSVLQIGQRNRPGEFHSNLY